MCFSATASFIAGTSLSAVGMASLKRIKARTERPFAMIPLLFGIQQLIEGVVWLTFRYDAMILKQTMTYLYSGFSHVLWPIYVPLGGLLSRRDWHFNWRIGHFMVDSFSIPFFTAAFLGLVTLFAALRWLRESLLTTSAQDINKETETNWRALIKSLSLLLALALAGQFALTIFEGTFALYAQAKFNYGPVEVGAVFMVCGLVMTVFQAGTVAFLAGRISEIHQIGAGFGLMGTGIALLATAHTKFFVFAFVALLALGMALIAPNLSALVSKRGGEQQTGASLGVQNAANSFGQAGGPLLGGVLFLWQINAPYLFSGIVLLAFAVVIAWKSLGRHANPNSLDVMEEQ